MKRYYHRILGDGVYISNNTRETRCSNNDLIVGSSGSCKTGSIVYTQLKSLKDSSLIVVDTKGRLFEMFREELQEKGFSVKVLDLVRPERSVRYNPFDYIREGEGSVARDQDIARLATALVPEETLDAREPIWEQSTRLMLEFFIAFTLSALPKEEHTMYTVSELYRTMFKKGGVWQFRTWLAEHPESLAAKRYDQLMAMQNADKMLGSICGFMNVALKPFDYEEYRYIFDTKADADGREHLDIASLGREKTVLFLNISDSDHSCDALVNIFYTQTLQTLLQEADESSGGELAVPVRVIMDDFASGALVPDFDKIISVVRSRDIWLTLCIQSFSQLESLYSHEQALTIVNNCDHIVYLGSNDLSSAEFIGTRAQKTPEKILAMNRDMEYVLEAGKMACLVKKIPPYQYEEPTSDFQNSKMKGISQPQA